VISPAALYAAKDAHTPVVLHLQNYRLFCANGLMVLDGRIHDDCVRGDYTCSVFHGLPKGEQSSRCTVRPESFYSSCLRSFELPNHFIAISNAVKDVFLRFGLPNDKITVLHHFIDTSLYESGKEDEGFYIYIGRLFKEKKE